MLDKLKSLGDIIAGIDEKVGFKKFSKYILLFAVVIAAFNLRSIVEYGVKYVQAVSEDMHYSKMEKRDIYISELNLILAEMRAELDADRILYFEYHNSIQNLDGLPFKFFDLVASHSAYGISQISPPNYVNTNTSLYTELFRDMDRGKILTCYGENDTEFRSKYPGVWNLFKENDRSSKFILVPLPGIKRPLGFLAIEWMDEDTPLETDREIINMYLPRINAIMVKSQG